MTTPWSVRNSLTTQKASESPNCDGASGGRAESGRQCSDSALGVRRQASGIRGAPLLAWYPQLSAALRGARSLRLCLLLGLLRLLWLWLLGGALGVGHLQPR